MLRYVAFTLATFVVVRSAHAQSFALSQADLADSAALSRAMPRLATEALDAYQHPARRTYLDNRFRLELVAGRYDAALRSLTELRTLRTSGVETTAQSRAANTQYEMYARAKTPGQRVQLPFRSGRLASQALPAGSRVIVLLTINKYPAAQINYGTAKDVSDESVADAKVPLEIEWYGSSYISVPVRR